MLIFFTLRGNSWREQKEVLHYTMICCTIPHPRHAISSESASRTCISSCKLCAHNGAVGLITHTGVASSVGGVGDGDGGPLGGPGRELSEVENVRELCNTKTYRCVHSQREYMQLFVSILPNAPTCTSRCNSFN